jgi:8-oxo-dGTP pyrophosphatase MutT (NUDIX family)
MLTPELIQQRLGSYQPQTANQQAERRAAVAMLLRQGEDGIDVLLIQRAEHELDPWSGDLSFPGGRIEPDDISEQAAAERETLEEIGIDLNNAQFLGRSDDLTGLRLSLNISCFVYFLGELLPFVLNEAEVKNCFWVPLRTLLQPERGETLCFSRPGVERHQPVIHLREWTAKPLWGITYRLINNFLCLFNLSFTNAKRI